MKADEAEKIYLQPSTIEELQHQNIVYTKPLADNSIEYTRTDAFIEKACDVYCRLCDTKECGDTGECVWVEKFRKRLMK